MSSSCVLAARPIARFAERRRDRGSLGRVASLMLDLFEEAFA